ncbi:MAG: N-6 DNA methylase, partial [Bacteroidota bacterium]
NPPFGSRVEKNFKITEADKYTDEDRIKKYQERYGPSYKNALRQVNDNIGKSLLSLYKTGEYSTLTEVLFIERCLNLLKPGGRLGIVLPEGVLNNSNLQKVRDFVESKAKILLITSIPQDVFMKSGANVKPSLLFFKKFTEEEAAKWKIITAKAKKDIESKYTERIILINNKLNIKGAGSLTADDKKRLKTELKQLEEQMGAEIKARIKTDFDYEIPIAQIEKAGISSTGGEIENELKPLAIEFAEYRKKNLLWESKFHTITYTILGDQQIYRVPIAGEPELFYK